MVALYMHALVEHETLLIKKLSSVTPKPSANQNKLLPFALTLVVMLDIKFMCTIKYE